MSPGVRLFLIVVAALIVAWILIGLLAGAPR